MFPEKLSILFSSKAFQLALLGLVLLLAALSLVVKPATQPAVSGVMIVDEGVEKEVVVEVAGEVKQPGVYRLPWDSRVDDLIMKAGGVTPLADTVWITKYLNRAAVLTDGQKYFIPSMGEQSQETSANQVGGDQSVSGVKSVIPGGLVNINAATVQELDALPGIGPVYSQKITEQRPYSNKEELLSRKVIPPSVYEKIKDLVSVY